MSAGVGASRPVFGALRDHGRWAAVEGRGGIGRPVALPGCLLQTESDGVCAYRAFYGLKLSALDGLDHVVPGGSDPPKGARRQSLPTSSGLFIFPSGLTWRKLPLPSLEQ